MTKLLLLIILSFIFFNGSAQKYTVTVHQPDPLKVNIPTTEFRILRGSKIALGNDISISGGSGHYTNIWSSSAWKADTISPVISVAPLDTTIYTLEVNDQYGCSVKQIFTVDVISTLQLACKVNQISCNGGPNGNIKLKVTGGAPPYQIVWSNGVISDELNNLSPGNYSVTVTDEMKQTQVKSITIKEPSPSITQLNATICNGGSYRFAGIVQTRAGQYLNTLTTKDGCDSMIILNLAVNPTSTKIIHAQICQGSTYNFGGIDRSISGKYQNTLQSRNGCDSIVILNLSVNILPNTPTITQNGDSLISSSAIGNQWLKDGSLISGENKQILVISSPGIYNVSVCNSSGCTLESPYLNAVITESAILQNVAITCNVFPNPNNGMFTVDLDSDKSEDIVLELFTSDGKSVIKQSVKHLPGEQRIPFGKAMLIKGEYNFQLKSATKTISKKLIVN